MPPKPHRVDSEERKAAQKPAGKAHRSEVKDSHDRYANAARKPKALKGKEKGG